MKPTTITLIDQPRQFEIDELFFSTTNSKGIIETGNDVFVRLSGYSRKELIAQPHSIIRHPHMPRAAFELVWSALLAGRPVAAYVKNLAKDGRYYWVLAFIAPIPGGFLSVRTRPCSKVFPLVMRVYEAMVTLENAELAAGRSPKQAMEASTALLGQRLRELGYDDYEDFVARAVVPAETTARREALSSHEHVLAVAEQNDARTALPEALSGPWRTVRAGLFAVREANHSFGAVLERAFNAITGTRRMLSEFVGIQLSAVNVSLRAARLGRHGKATMAIAEFLAQATDKLHEEMDALCKSLDEGRVALGGLVLELGWSSLEVEMVLEAIDECLAAQQQRGPSDELAVHFLGLERLHEGLTGTIGRLGERGRAFRSSLTKAMRRADWVRQHALSLEAAYTGGRVESARLPAESQLGELLEELGRRLGSAREAVEETQRAAGDLATVETITHQAQDALQSTGIALKGLLDALRNVSARAA